jgi:hypothetical protein
VHAYLRKAETSSRRQFVAPQLEAIHTTEAIALLPCGAKGGGSCPGTLSFGYILRENGLCFELSVCLSRACLGKKISLRYKWRKKTDISPLHRGGWRRQRCGRR